MLERKESRGEHAPKTGAALTLPDSPAHMQPLKSISAAFVVAPGVTVSCPAGVLAFLLVVIDGGEQIGALVVGFVASASTL